MSRRAPALHRRTAPVRGLLLGLLVGQLPTRRASPRAARAAFDASTGGDGASRSPTADARGPPGRGSRTDQKRPVPHRDPGARHQRRMASEARRARPPSSDERGLEEEVVAPSEFVVAVARARESTEFGATFHLRTRELCRRPFVLRDGYVFRSGCPGRPPRRCRWGRRTQRCACPTVGPPAR